jgi:hypothetical protein
LVARCHQPLFLLREFRQLGDIRRNRPPTHRQAPVPRLNWWLWFTVHGLCYESNEAFHRFNCFVLAIRNLLAFAIVGLWIGAPVDG